MFGFFWYVKFGKICNIFNLGFFQFKRFFTENDPGYGFCVFNYLRFTVKEVAKKRKLDHYRIYSICLIEECLAASCIFSISMISI